MCRPGSEDPIGVSGIVFIFFKLFLLYFYIFSFFFSSSFFLLVVIFQLGHCHVFSSFSPPLGSSLTGPSFSLNNFFKLPF